MNARQGKLVVASSIEEEQISYIFEPTPQKRPGEKEELSTPDNKKPNVESCDSNKSPSSRFGTPYKKSIFDVKSDKRESRESKDSPKRPGKAKKPMIASNNILSYFSPKKDK